MADEPKIKTSFDAAVEERQKAADAALESLAAVKEAQTWIKRNVNRINRLILDALEADEQMAHRIAQLRERFEQEAYEQHKHETAKRDDKTTDSAS